MDGFLIARQSIVAPLKFWRLMLRAAVPILPFFAFAIIVRLPFDLAANFDSVHPARLGSLGLLWIGVSLFEWNWLGLQRAPQSSWRDRLRGQVFVFIVFATVSWVLLGISKLPEILRPFLESYDPIVNQVGDTTYYATSFRTLGLYLLLTISLCWLRLRLLFWPIDIFASRRLTSPATSWHMTKGQVTELIFMVVAIAVSIGAVGGFSAGVGYLFFGKIGYTLAFPALIWYVAALDYAYLQCHRVLQPGSRHATTTAVAAR